MGGLNSGRRNAKACTDEQRSIDVRRFHRDGLLLAGNTFSTTWTRRGETVARVLVRVGFDCVVFSYRQSWRGAPWRDCTNTVLLTWTECNYGGKRPWWQCPGCDRRVALLYSGNGWYACLSSLGVTGANTSRRQPESKTETVVPAQQGTAQRQTAEGKPWRDIKRNQRTTFGGTFGGTNRPSIRHSPAYMRVPGHDVKPSFATN